MLRGGEVDWTVTKLSEALAEFCAAVRYEDLPPAAVEMARKSLLDWLGSALAGSTQPPAEMAPRFAVTLGGRSEAILVGTTLRADVLRAAFLNGLAAHIVELDDLHRPSTLHAGAPVIAAALAATEREGSSGRRLIEALVVGYEVAIRIAEAVNPSHYRFWHNTATCGMFGAAAAVAKVLTLDRDVFVHAMGSAGTLAAGLWEFLKEGAMSKHLHTGHAAHDGALAAYLAREGFTAARAILEGEKGFFHAMAVDANPDKITRGLGNIFKITENSFKLYPCCGHTHSAIAAALEIRRRWAVDPDEIQEIRVQTYRAALEIAGNSEPATIYQAKFSLPYTVAAAFVRGRVGLSEFEPEALSDHKLRKLMTRIQLEMAPDLDARYPGTWAATVVVTSRDGREHRQTIDRSPGEDGSVLGFDALARKFDELLAWAKAQAPRSAAELDLYADAANALRRLEQAERITPGAIAGLIVTAKATHRQT
jgi:2-methylcitrate dehydratase PrpD